MTPLETAIQAARKAGEILIENYGKLTQRQIVSKGLSDYVTEIDHLCEKEVIGIIHKKFPDHAILAEESGQGKEKSECRWIIDPLDGTTNYIHGFPFFSVSIGLEVRGQRQIGIVYDPLHDELFHAEKGKGAFLNGKKISVSRRTDPREALIATGFPFRIHKRLDEYLPTFRAILLEVAGLRRAGSAALDLAYTACGRVDGFWEMGLSPWDICAGALLVEEAGGIFSGFRGETAIDQRGDVVCGSPTIHHFLRQKLKESLNLD